MRRRHLRMANHMDTGNRGCVAAAVLEGAKSVSLEL